MLEVQRPLLKAHLVLSSSFKNSISKCLTTNNVEEKVLVNLAIKIKV